MGKAPGALAVYPATAISPGVALAPHGLPVLAVPVLAVPLLALPLLAVPLFAARLAGGRDSASALWRVIDTESRQAQEPAEPWPLQLLAPGLDPSMLA